MGHFSEWKNTNKSSDSSAVEHAHENVAHQITWSERIKHFTWAWFTVPLSSSGVGLLLAGTPHRFDGLETIGKIFFIFAIVTFLGGLALIIQRFVRVPCAMSCSLQHPLESLFFPTAVLTIATLSMCAQIYGGPSCGEWLVTTLRVIFWIYVALAFSVTCLQYLSLFSAPAKRLTIQGMTPAWILPTFPVLLGATLASILSPTQPPDARLSILIAGITMQGTGWMIAFMMFSIYLHRLMEHGLPAPNLRPGMFIAVGPPSFTGLAVISLSEALPTDYAYFAAIPQAVTILQVVALFFGIFLWLLAFWFWCVTLLAVLAGAQRLRFHLVWWALVFPNIPFALLTGKIGEALGSPGIAWVATAITIMIVAGFLVVLFFNIWAVLKKEILMPGKDEDRECGGPNV